MEVKCWFALLSGFARVNIIYILLCPVGTGFSRIVFYCLSGCPVLPFLAANVLALPEEAPALLSYEVWWSRPAPLAV